MKCSMLVLLVFFLSLSAGDLTPPELLTPITPHYPKHLKRQGVEGNVELLLLINESGSVEQCSITKPVHSILDTLSLRAARQLKFTPGTVDGEPVAVELPYRFSFSLQPELDQLKNIVRIEGSLSCKGNSQPVKNAVIQYETLEERLSDLPTNRVLEHLGNFNNQYFEENRLGTESDSLGRFYFYGIPQGKFRLTALSENTHPATIVDSLRESRKLTVELRPEPLDYNEYEVVTSYRTHSEVSERILSSEELGTVAGSAGDPVKALQSLPGVSRSASGDDMVFRGASPDDNRFYLEDIEIPYLFHDGGRRSVIPSRALTEIGFYPSAYSAYYGAGIGGVVCAKTDLPKRKKISAIADINLIDMGFFFDTAPVKNLQITAGARLSDRTGFTKRYMEELEGDRAVLPRYADFFSKLRFTPFKNHTIDMVFLGAKDSLVTPTNSDIAAPKDNRGFYTISMIWNWKISNSLTQMISFGYLYERDGHQRTIPYVHWRRYQNYAYSSQFRSRWNWTPTEKVTLSGGVNGKSVATKQGIQNYPLTTKIVSEAVYGGSNSGVVSPWMELTLTPREPLTIQLGARYDYYAELTHSGTVLPAFSQGSGGSSGVSGDPSLRAALRWQVSDKNLIKAALGNYNQSPEPFELLRDERYGDPSLSTTKAAHYTIGYEHYLDNYSFDIQGFYNSRWDIPYCEFTTTAEFMIGDSLKRADTLYTWSQNGTGRAYGIELMIKRARTEHFSGWLSYTLSKSEEKTFHDYHPIDHDQTHNLQLLGNFFLPKRWEIGGKLHYTTGNPTTPPESFSAEIQDRSAEYNSERLDPGVLLDLRVAKKLPARKVTTEIYCDIQNLLYPIYKSPEYTEYDPVTGEAIHFYTPIIPTLGVKVSF